MNNPALSFEIQRKLFHVYSVAFPILYIFVSQIAMCFLLIIVTGITFYLDVSRHYNDKIKKLIDKLCGKILRSEEQNGYFALSGSSHMALGFLISCFLFPKGLVIASWFILIISDAIAALVGIKFGATLYNGKSYIGSASFFISSIVISLISSNIVEYNTNFFIIIVSSFCATLVEFFSKQIQLNDNFLIPITYATTTSILWFLF